MTAEAEGFGAPAEKKGMGTFAKVAIGCGILLILVCGVLGYMGFRLMKFGMVLGQHAEEISAAQGTETRELLDQANTENPFTEPDPPSATSVRLEAFMAVRQEAHSQAQGALEAQEAFEKGPSGVREAFDMIKDTFVKWAAARKGFAQALIDGGMSESEYIYLFRLAYLSNIVETDEDVLAEIFVQLPPIPDVPEATKEVVRSFADRIAAEGVSAKDEIILGFGADEWAQKQRRGF